ncbi:MAG TPA: carbohydrate kinase [Candidatus Baltobacterales bacterium]|nr:carbohydrate kinase [Candidatus Baltobacterales bacterium]
MIAVCGEALIDIVGDGDGTQSARPGGGPFNTARALARLGVPTAFLGRLSSDMFGRELAGRLAADGVDLSMASSGPEPTTIAVTDVDGYGVAAYSFLVEGTSAPNFTTAMLPERLPPEVSALHVGTLGLLLEPMALTMVELIQREGDRRLVMIDPNVRPALLGDDGDYRRRLEWVIARSAIVKASDDDLAWLYPGLDYETAVDSILSLGVRLVVATLGAQGAFGASPGARIQVSAPPVQVVDTIGAGDAFGAALLAWLHDGGRLSRDLSLGVGDLQAALSFACLVASTTCTRAGAEPPWRAEVLGGEKAL